MRNASLRGGIIQTIGRRHWIRVKSIGTTIFAGLKKLFGQTTENCLSLLSRMNRSVSFASTLSPVRRGSPSTSFLNFIGADWACHSSSKSQTFSTMHRKRSASYGRKFVTGTLRPSQYSLMPDMSALTREPGLLFQNGGKSSHRSAERDDNALIIGHSEPVRANSSAISRIFAASEDLPSRS